MDAILIVILRFTQGQPPPNETVEELYVYNLAVMIEIVFSGKKETVHVQSPTFSIQPASFHNAFATLCDYNVAWFEAVDVGHDELMG